MPGRGHTCDPLSQDVCAALFTRGTRSGAGGGALPHPHPTPPASPHTHTQPPPPPRPPLPNQSSQQRINRPKANTGPREGHRRLQDAVTKKNSHNKNKIRGGKKPKPNQRGEWGAAIRWSLGPNSRVQAQFANPTVAPGLAAPTPGAYEGCNAAGIGLDLWLSGCAGCPPRRGSGGSGRIGNPV